MVKKFPFDIQQIKSRRLYRQIRWAEQSFKARIYWWLEIREI
jgi:hypothetical protein